jgi:hypothetical protein
MKKQLRRRWAADPSVLGRVLGKVQAFTTTELVRLQTPVRLAWESLRTGQGEAADYHTLAAAINVALVRSEDIDALTVDVCIRAQDALMAMSGRFDRTGKWGVDWSALQHIPVAIDLYEQLLDHSTPLQMQAAMTATLQRIQAGQVLGGAT